jgi:4-carboxymuconolactone decarboxylase
VSGASAPRLAPIPPGEWSDDARAALANAYPDDVVQRLLSTEPGSQPMPNALATMAHHPALMGPFLVYNNVLLQRPALSPRQRELAVLRVAWRTRSRYEWMQHLRLAPRVAITPEEIAAVADGPGAVTWSPLEADLLAATDQLIDGYRVEDETWNRLAEHLDERQLVELVFTVGTYTALAMAFRSFGLELDPDLQEIVTKTSGTSLPEFEE